MKRKIVGILLACAVFVGGAATAVAAGVVQDITAQIRPDFTIVIDGVERSFSDVNGNIVYPVYYNGTTYLPVRAIGGIMGKEVGWDGNTKTVTLSEPAKQPVVSGVFDETTVLGQLEVTEYHRNYAGGGSLYLVIKNNSEFNIGISVDAKFYDANGALVGAQESSAMAVGAGTEAFIALTNNVEFASATHEIGVSEESYTVCQNNDVSFESVRAENKEIVTVRNNGNSDIDSVNIDALFFKDGKVVGWGLGIFGSDGLTLEAGKEDTSEILCVYDYDEVKFFLSAWSFTW